MRNNRIPYNGDICTAVASCNYIQFDRQKKHSAGSQKLGGKSRNGYGSHLPYIKRSNILYDFLGGSHVGIYKGSAAVGSDGHCYCNLCGAEKANLLLSAGTERLLNFLDFFIHDEILLLQIIENQNGSSSSAEISSNEPSDLGVL